MRTVGLIIKEKPKKEDLEKLKNKPKKEDLEKPKENLENGEQNGEVQE